MTFDELSQSTGSYLYPGNDKGFNSVCIDSRKITPGALFVALAGAIQDGHSYIESALEAGAAGIMAARSRLESFNIVNLVKKWGKTLLVADDTLRGLQNAAEFYLTKFNQLLKIAITGSSGKTTTKEIAAAIIGQEKNVVMNSGNLNSETGLPLSVFNVRGEHETGIFEAGMNRRGEIAELAKVLKPNIALITNIGSAHIGILGSKAAIAEEKKNIFSNFNGAGIALIPSDDQFCDFLSQNINGEVIRYGFDNFFKPENIINRGLDGYEITWAGLKINFPLPGMHNLRNAVSALAIANVLKISAESVRKGLESIKPIFGRSEIFRSDVTVIRDCYNSNPESLDSVLASCDSVKWQGRKIYVIGAMLELGDISVKAHEDMGNRLAESDADMIFLYGRETETAAAKLSTAGISFYITEKMDELKKNLRQFIRAGDLILLKGSRGCALEELTPVLLPELSGGGF